MQCYTCVQSDTAPADDGVSRLGGLGRKLTNSHRTGNPFSSACAVSVIVVVHMLSAPAALAVAPAAMPPVADEDPSS